MITLMIAAAAAAAQPAPSNSQGQPAEHKGMECCHECCKDMAAKHEGHDSKHAQPSAH